MFAFVLQALGWIAFVAMFIRTLMLLEYSKMVPGSDSRSIAIVGIVAAFIAIIAFRMFGFGMFDALPFGFLAAFVLHSAIYGDRVKQIMDHKKTFAAG